jgi:hypothetical protein
VSIFSDISGLFFKKSRLCSHGKFFGDTFGAARIDAA